jgi:hypothetical protein
MYPEGIMAQLHEIKRLSDITGVSFDAAQNAYYTADGGYYKALHILSEKGETRVKQPVRQEKAPFFDRFLASYLVVETSSDIRIPLIVACLIGLVTLEFILPILLIMFVCGVGFRLEGDLFEKEIALRMTPRKSAETYTYTGTAGSTYGSAKKPRSFTAKDVEYTDASDSTFRVHKDRSSARRSDTVSYDSIYSGVSEEMHDVSEDKGFFA